MPTDLDAAVDRLRRYKYGGNRVYEKRDEPYDVDLDRIQRDKDYAADAYLRLRPPGPRPTAFVAKPKDLDTALWVYRDGKLARVWWDDVRYHKWTSGGAMPAIMADGAYMDPALALLGAWHDAVEFYERVSGQFHEKWEQLQAELSKSVEK